MRIGKNLKFWLDGIINKEIMGFEKYFFYIGVGSLVFGVIFADVNALLISFLNFFMMPLGELIDKSNKFRLTALSFGGLIVSCIGGWGLGGLGDITSMPTITAITLLILGVLITTFSFSMSKA